MHNCLSITPLVRSLRDLEFRLGETRGALCELVKSGAVLYHPFELPKKQHPFPGKARNLEAQTAQPKYRQIDNPVDKLKVIQKRILRRILIEVDLPAYMFG